MPTEKTAATIATEKMSPALTWDDLANLYNKRTGGHAGTCSMDSIFDWALTQKDIRKDPSKGTVHLIS